VMAGATVGAAVTADAALGDATPVDRAGSSPDAGTVADCVFCAEAAHPAALLQTDRLALIPDLYPLMPGHLLVITRNHELCMGSAPDAVRAELPGLVDEASRFIRGEYGLEPLLWENGVAGQTVPHAHLHLIPIAVDDLADSLTADPDSVEISGWDQVAARFRDAGEYHYIRVRERGFLVEGNGAMNWEGRRRLAMAAGMGRVTGKILRAKREDDIADVAARWRAWKGDRRA
ncbi:MAG: HIT domain-containing protein, partial [Candidatus Dormiibacterota bacterium]